MLSVFCLRCSQFTFLYLLSIVEEISDVHASEGTSTLPPPAMTASEVKGGANHANNQDGRADEYQHDKAIEHVNNNGDVKSERRTGSCKWFNVLKGFGFIVLDNTLEDVFVHQSELKMEGFRSLEEGERVSFFVRTRNSGQRVGALEAWQVGPEDESKTLIGSSIRPLGAKKDRMIRCYKCGRFGNHMAQKCKKVDMDQKVCYGCGSSDHLFSTCPKVAHRTKPKSDGENLNELSKPASN